MSLVDEFFDNLDDWRQLPAYNLERRTNAFFSIGLPQDSSVIGGFEHTDLIGYIGFCR